MKRYRTLFVEALACISIYPLLLVLLIISGLSCGLLFSFLPSLGETDRTSGVIQIRSLAALPTGSLASTPVYEVVAESSLPSPAAQEASSAGQPVTSEANIPAPLELAQPAEPDTAQLPAGQAPADPNTVTVPVEGVEGQVVPPAPAGEIEPTPTAPPDFEFPEPLDRPHRPTPTPEPGLLDLVAGLIEGQDKPESSTHLTRTEVSLPTLTATPTSTDTPLPTATPTETPLPTETPTPTETPLPTPTSTETPTPLPTNTRVPPPPTPVPLPTETPLPTATPVPDYDFNVAEFYNSPTTNSFLVMYVAIVDANNIPIGDLRIVGTRTDHNLTYQSPLSTWHFEGYNAPGEVIKSGNVKFEPPGGIETVKWIIHLEDANGVRLSEDIPFNTDQNDKQWYFVMLRREY